MARPGPRKKPREVVKGVRLQVVFTPSEAAEIREDAGEFGSVSAWLHDAAKEKLARKKATKKRPK